jgi:hypothetical protein
MRRRLRLPPERRTLQYPETVLLVHNAEAQPVELDPLLDESMRSDDDVRFPFLDLLSEAFPPLPREEGGEKDDPDR